MEDTISPEELEALEAELPRKSWNGKRIVLVILTALGLAAGVYGLQYVGAPEPAEAAAEMPRYVEVPDMMVNLRTSGGERRYLKVRVTLEAASASDAREIEARLPAVIDGFQSFLRELRPEDLAGSAGTYRIKEELMIRVNRASAPARATDVLVQELIQQ